MDKHDIPNPSSASYDLSRMMQLQYGPQSGYVRLAKRALTHSSAIDRVNRGICDTAAEDCRGMGSGTL